MKLSIIIPIYNAERYIKKCLESIKNQSFNDYELILINDGSEDKSLEILNDFKNNNIDMKITIKSVVNGGVSKARNIGIGLANSEYITFIDADDYLDDNTYDIVFEMNNNFDIIGYSYKLEYPTHNKSVLFPFKAEYKILTNEEIMNNLISKLLPVKRKEMGIAALTMRFIYKKEVVATFNETIHIQEDVLFCIQTFLKAKRVLLINKPLYHYVQNVYSATNGYQRNLVEQFELLNAIIREEFSSEKYMSKSFNKQISSRDAMCLTLSISNCYRKNSPDDEDAEFKKIKNYCKKIPLSSIIFNEYCNISRKITIVMLKIKLDFLVKKLYKLKEDKRRELLDDREI